MPGIDASIPLGVQQPDGMRTLSSMLGMKTAIQNQDLQQQAMQSNAMANQQSQIDLQETQAAREVMKNVKQYQDTDGNIDYNRLLPDMMQAAPKNGAKFVQNVMAMQQQANVAKQSWMQASQQQRDSIGSIATSLIDQDPDVAVKTFDAVAGSPAFANMTPSIQHMQTELHAAAQTKDRGATNAVLKRIGAMSTPVTAQQPNVAMVSTEEGTQPVNTNQLAPGGVGPMGKPLSTPNQLAPTTSGGTAIVNPTKKTATPIASTATPMDFPQGENRDTQAELQAQRTASQQLANQAPTLHNINQGIVKAVDGGVKTGKWGALTQEISSRLGYVMSGDDATDYNVLGKLLQRSALTAAQGMGPHTNAGLEAQIQANGSTEYTPQAIRKIATLNDALTTGSSMYQNGLENAVSGPEGVFAKRKFDQQWANAMNPSAGVDGVQALRFKNAVDNGDTKDIQSIIKDVGGANSKGAQALYSKLQAIRRLAGEQ